ncbi:pirin family protein [Planktosalinus lacus]|uniref:Pirin n=1 Tax=Planktosalinus lacus TaxID=1526573 RepID=A0A8J2VAW2_9FLAO|nr:pirin-like C-terminal cupin domain-containing protein [Planktosalinus lacus]GGD94025.1 hypothetical protein GCM10011312_17180 [Planktosalinus lacus]
MSNIDLIIEERSRDIGDFLVGRLLPFRKKRMVGPFIFIDHMGPTKLGSEQIIKSGAVNWMVAGKGVTHTERKPSALRNKNKFIAHGYQIWVALPKKFEDCEPEFHHFDVEQLPKWREGSATFKLIAGEGYGKKSPVPVKSELFMIEIKTEKQFELNTKNNLQVEIGICIVEGEIEACGTSIKKGNMMVSKVENTCNVTIKPKTHLLLFGGKPYEEERFIYWNFVSSDKNKLEKAKIDWKNNAFLKVPGDTTYVKMPEY